MKKILGFFVLSIISLSVFSQTKTLKGKVSNEDGGVLQGVTVNLKGSKSSTQTAADGTFSISVPDNQSNVLQFSFVNYTTKEVSVKNQKEIKVTLSLTDKQLDEVVVIGYGTVKKKDLTGSVSKVEMVELQKAPVRSFEEALGGRVAGVQVSSSDGQPGSPVSIVIRGNNSLTQDNSPLYVIDGVPVENPNNNAVNPSDIESIEVLKDAASAAIYGSRGASGVILITTKSGKIDKVTEGEIGGTECQKCHY